jgi:hypothetical protein
MSALSCKSILWILDTLLFNNQDLTHISIHLRYIHVQLCLQKESIKCTEMFDNSYKI